MSTAGRVTSPKGQKDMHIRELAARSGIEQRTLRYIVDHGTIPSVGKDNGRRGGPRVLSERNAIAVAVAALLLHAGLKRRFVEGFVRGLLSKRSTDANSPPPGVEWLVGRVGGAAAVLSLEIGDRRYVRNLSGSGADSMGWRDLLTGSTVATVAPLVIVRIDMVELRRRIRAP